MTSINLMSKFVDNNTVTGGPKIIQQVKASRKSTIKIKKILFCLERFLKVKIKLFISY